VVATNCGNARRRNRRWINARLASGVAGTSLWGVEALEARRLLAAVSWDGGGDGTKWSDPLNWSNNAVPQAADDVTINVLGSPSIVVSLGPYTIHSLVSGEVLSIQTTLSVTTTAQASERVSVSGMLSGGLWTMQNGASVTTTSGSIGNGLTLNGNISVDNGGTLTVSGGLTLNGKMGIYAGTLATGVSFAGTQTLGGTGTVSFEGTASTIGFLRQANAGDTLTIGSGITVRNGSPGGAGTATIGQLFATGRTIVNQGTITFSSTALKFTGVSITNGGTIAATGSTTLLAIDNLTNSATGFVTAASGTALTLTGAFSNAGTISSNGATVNFNANLTPATLGTFNRTGGTVNLGATLTGGLTLDATTGSWNLARGATINGGTVNLSGGAILAATSFCTLSGGVTINGTFEVGDRLSVTVSGGLTVNGTIDIRGIISNSILFDGSQTLGGHADVVFNCTNVGTEVGISNAGGTLTIGPDVTIRTGTQGGYVGRSVAGTNVINNGTIIAQQTTYSGLGVVGDTVINNGTMSVSDGGRLAVTNLRNSASGSITAKDDGKLFFDDTYVNNGTITSNNGSVQFSFNFAQADLGAFNRVGGTVTAAGVISGGLTLDALTGPWNLSFATIDGGAINNTSGLPIVVTGNSTLAGGIVLNSDVQLADGATLTATGGLTLNGVLEVQAAAATTATGVSFSGSQTLGGNGSIVFNGTSSNGVVQPAASGDVLTIGPNITVRTGTQGGTLGSAAGGRSVINQGTITAQTTSRTLTVTGDAVTNRGAMAATAGTLAVTNLTNPSGKTVAATNAALTLGGTIANSGVLTSTNSTVTITGNFSQWMLGTLNRTGGAVNISGTLSGGLTLNASTGSWALVNGGTINGGTVNATGGARLDIKPGGGTLAGGVTLNTDLNLFNAAVTVTGGLTLNGTATLETTSPFSGAMLFNGSQTLGGTGEVVFEGTVTTGGVSPAAAGQTLTIGPGITVRTGAQSGRVGNGVTGWFVINKGTISAQTAGKTITVAGTFTNGGVVEATNGGTLRVNGTPTNFSNGTLTGGTWKVDTGSTMQLAGTNVATNAATVILNGPAASLYNATSGTTSALAPLAANASGGVIVLSGGQDLSTTGAFTNQGALSLGSGSVLATAGAFTQGAAATLHVDIAGPNAGDFGQVSSGGTATLDGALTAALAGGYEPNVSTAYPIVVASSRSSTFSSFSGGPSPGGATLHESDDLTGVSVVATPTTPAWLEPGSAATWDGATLTVSGAARIAGDPGDDAVAVRVSGAGASLLIDAGAAPVVHLQALHLSNGAVVSIAAHAPDQPPATLVLAAGTPVIDPTSNLDLANNAMVVRQGSLAAVRSAISSAFNHGTWDGFGISSSVAGAAPAGLTSLGSASNAELERTEFAGVTGLAADDVLVKFTYAGDANLDGQVDIGDLGLLSGNWQQSGKDWFGGDFTYDGIVNIGDLGALAGNWQKGVGNPI
jgi:hypothetical protein